MSPSINFVFLFLNLKIYCQKLLLRSIISFVALKSRVFLGGIKPLTPVHLNVHIWSTQAVRPDHQRFSESPVTPVTEKPCPKKYLLRLPLPHFSPGLCGGALNVAVRPDQPIKILLH